MYIIKSEREKMHYIIQKKQRQREREIHSFSFDGGNVLTNDV